jgi:seryl-tRNA synthetase
MDEDKPYVNVRREPASTSYYVSMDTNKPMGCSMRIDHLLDMLQERASSIAEQIQEAKKQAELAEEDINKGNPYQKQVEDLAIELAEIDYELTMKEVM